MKLLLKGDFPRWNVQIQIMPEADAAKHNYAFDLTKSMATTKKYPVIDIGVLELNRNPQNYFAEVEQAAFAPSNIVPTELASRRIVCSKVVCSLTKMRNVIVSG